MGHMHLSDVSSKYGAPMGRREYTVPAEEHKNLGKFELQIVRLNQGGYDAGGAYWGTGETLYRARAFVDCTGREGFGDSMVEFYLRAPLRDDAKAHVRKAYPNARFYR